MKLLIVDDEPLARVRLARLCERSDDLHVVGEAESGAAAIKAAQKLSPDVMLLDVELPDMTGFDVLRAVRTDAAPLGIMVTAHAEHAVTAFDAGAFDYLLKPFRDERFFRCIDRARQRCEAPLTWTEPVSSPPPLPGVLSAGRRPRLLVGEREHRLYPLDPDKIDYIESAGNYVKFCVGRTEYISRDTVKRLALALSDRGFVRIERSLLVNVRAVLYVEPAGRGSFAFTLGSGACLYSSPTYRDAILRVLPLAQTSNRMSPALTGAG